MKQLKIGDTVWRFDHNYRIYRSGQSGPVWREHWRPYEIFGETSRSWLVGNKHRPFKIPKNGKRMHGERWVFSEHEIDQQEWIEKHAYQLRDAVGRSREFWKLLSIARLLEHPSAESGELLERSEDPR